MKALKAAADAYLRQKKDDKAAAIENEVEALLADRPRAIGMPQLDYDRRAAEYVLSIGGTVRLNGGDENVTDPNPDRILYPWARATPDKKRDVKAVSDLPAGPFRLTWVELRDNQRLDDAGLLRFRGCTHLMYLDLWRTNVTDVGLSNFKNCKDLRQVNLCITATSDVGLAQFKNCNKLRALCLEGTRVTDEGLALFAGSQSLTHVTLQNTQVTDIGLGALTASKNLMSIDLNRTQTTDKGIFYLMRCKDLKMAALVFTNVTPQGKDALRKRFPSCKIHEH